jgi:hypothetical protein
LPLLTILIGIAAGRRRLCLFVKANAARWIALIATMIELA